jgi:hypothetical protein
MFKVQAKGLKNPFGVFSMGLPGKKSINKDNELLQVSIIVINKAVRSGCQFIISINICLYSVKFENIWFFVIKVQLVL